MENIGRRMMDRSHDNIVELRNILQLTITLGSISLDKGDRLPYPSTVVLDPYSLFLLIYKQ